MISNKIDLSNYQRRYRETDRFRNDLLEVLGNNLFQYESIDDIIFYSLKAIKPVNRYIKNNPKSIEKKAGDVLEYFKMKTLLKSSIKDFSGKVLSTNDDEFEKSYKQRYIENILRLKQPPKFEYDRLLIEAEQHLQEINKNIDYYNAQKFIIEFKNKNSTPKNHYERTLLDFYFRCIDEQQEILNFILVHDKKYNLLKMNRLNVK